MELQSLQLSFVTPTNIIILVTAIISFRAFGNRRLMHDLTMRPVKIRSDREYYRFLTSGFIHNDHLHLIFNMIALYSFGPVVQKVFNIYSEGMGTVYYIILYIAGIVVSDIPTYFKHRHDAAYSSLGASGGVSSVVFAFILFLPLQKIDLFLLVPIPGFILGALYIMYSYFHGKRSADNINHDAHLFGALFGLVYCIVLYPFSVHNFIEQVSHWRAF